MKKIDEEYKRMLEELPLNEYQKMIMGDWSSSSKEFQEWIKKTYPEIHLMEWQQNVVEMIYSRGRGAGKSFLVHLLREYEQTLQRGEDHE